MAASIRPLGSLSVQKLCLIGNKAGLYSEGKMTQWLRVVLGEDAGLIPSTHVEVYNLLWSIILTGE